MIISQVIDDVSRYLQDNEFEDDVQYVHWTKGDLLTYAQLALSIIAMVRKEDFTETVDVELVEGAVQTIPAQCKSVQTVQGQKNDDGVIVSRLREVRISNLSAFSRPVCKPSVKFGASSEYRVKSFSYDDNDPRVIYVDPPVPANTNATLTISCYAPPVVKGEDDEIDLDQNLVAVVFELMLYYAYGVDIEDAPARERSMAHWKNALDLLQIYDYKERSALERVVRG